MIGVMAGEEGYRAFVVGGAVRDLILGAGNFDIDIVVEGNAVKFAKNFADFVKGSLVTHKKFGTATVMMAWGRTKKERLRVDFATSRKEKYSYPGALPYVESSGLRDDLYRRDFTINAMAVALNSGNFGELIDLFGGMEHLQQGTVSVLHEGSFTDDPTRIFRAVRFEQRLGFKIDAFTERLIKKAIKSQMFSAAGNIRIREELILMLSEEDPLPAVTRMHQLDELRFIHPGIKMGPGTGLLFKSVDKAWQWHERHKTVEEDPKKWLMYLMALFEGLSGDDNRAVCAKFAFSRADSARLILYKEDAGGALEILSQKKTVAPSAVYGRLRGLPYEVILMLYAKAGTKKAEERLEDFILKHGRMKTETNGNDLRRMGFKSGPRIGAVLDEILFARIDGKLKTRQDELSFARSLLK